MITMKTRHGKRRILHQGAVGGAGGDVGVVVGVKHRPRSWSLSGSGAGEDAVGADQARRPTSSTETDWGSRSHGGPGHTRGGPSSGGTRLGAKQGAVRRFRNLR